MKTRIHASIRHTARFALIVALAAGWAGIAPSHARAQGTKTTTRPFSDWLSTQGTYCAAPFGAGGGCLFTPPAPNVLGWTTTVAEDMFSLIDYAGVQNAWLRSQPGGFSLGTEVSGTVTERALSNGSAEVTVLAHTTNAFAWVIACTGSLNCDFANGPLLFGHRAQDVLAGEDAALATCNLQVVFINTAPGPPLPDLVQLATAPAAGTALRFLAFQASAKGTLRANFGVPDGTPGSEHLMETGTLMAQGNGGPRGDFFPAEYIELRVTGQ